MNAKEMLKSSLPVYIYILNNNNNDCSLAMSAVMHFVVLTMYAYAHAFSSMVITLAQWLCVCVHLALLMNSGKKCVHNFSCSGKKEKKSQADQLNPSVQASERASKPASDQDKRNCAKNI